MVVHNGILFWREDASRGGGGLLSRGTDEGSMIFAAEGAQVDVEAIGSVAIVDVPRHADISVGVGKTVGETSTASLCTG